MNPAGGAGACKMHDLIKAIISESKRAYGQNRELQGLKVN